jgi:hypothetical protein
MQPLVLYHGTIEPSVGSILQSIELKAGRLNTDFGQGFYITASLKQAAKWAIRLSERSRKRPAIVEFIVDRHSLAMLDTLWFVSGLIDSEDYWSLVWHCRSGRVHFHPYHSDGWYDLVIGPVSKRWQVRKVKLNSDQVSFHSQRAVGLLDASKKSVIYDF